MALIFKKLLPILTIVVLLCSCTATPIAPDVNTDKQASDKPVQQGTENTESMASEEASKEVEKPSTPSSPLSGKIIVVDAGHGLFSQGRQEAIAPGSSQTKPAFASGTAGKNQTEEELNLSVALKLQSALEAKGAIVHMTRETHDTQRSNIDRATFANDLNAHISVKLHADGNSSSSAKGMSMLIPGNQYISDADLLEKSKLAGSYILDECIKTTGAINRGLSVRNDMTGFNWSTVPVVLLEMGFMTNPDEDALMETDAYQNKIVDGIVIGLERYFSE